PRARFHAGLSTETRLELAPLGICAEEASFAAQADVHGYAETEPGYPPASSDLRAGGAAGRSAGIRGARRRRRSCPAGLVGRVRVPLGDAPVRPADRSAAPVGPAIREAGCFFQSSFKTCESGITPALEW